MHVNFQPSLEMIYATPIVRPCSSFPHIFPLTMYVVNIGVDRLLAGNIRLPIFLFKPVSIVSVNLHISAFLTVLFIFVVWSIRSYHAKIVSSRLGIPIFFSPRRNRREAISRRNIRSLLERKKDVRVVAIIPTIPPNIQLDTVKIVNMSAQLNNKVHIQLVSIRCPEVLYDQVIPQSRWGS